MGRKPRGAHRANRTLQVRATLLIFLVGILPFVFVFRELYNWQIVRGDELTSLAVRQQTLRTTVDASRGTIYDRNGYTLAVSATAENICVSPAEIKKYEEEQQKKDADKRNEKQNKDFIAAGLAEILGMEKDDVLARLEKTNTQYQVLKKRAEQETADAVRAFINENKLHGIFLEPTSKRYYPYSALASHVLGFTNENGGAYGLEAVYDKELAGQSGMVVTAKNAEGTSVLYQYEQYFDAKNGNDLHTTLDKTVQLYLEQGLEELESRFGTGKGATGIVMDVNTAAILAMASLPNYDLNSPSALYSDILDTSGLPDSLSELRLQQWRNKAINDTYEPGSTFKILTLSMALEEGVVDLNTTFQCTGNVHIDEFTINCSNRSGHGQQTLTEAAGNSCNPAFINIGLRVGNEKFYQYMKDFGLTEKTKIDTTGEAEGFVNKEITYSQLALACYAFGQNFNVTPVALLAAQAACVNGGYLREPYIVESITDPDGNVVMQHDSTPIRQVISEETSATVRGVLEYVVSEGTGKNGRVAGYRIGGKTGTADKVGGNVIVSFVCFAPADDPQVIMLLTLDEPNRDTGTYVSGGNMAAPVAASVMSNILPYLGFEPSYSAEELVGADANVPNVTGMERDKAIETLQKGGFGYRLVGGGEIVTDQTPLGDAIVPNNAEIILYLGEQKPDAPCVVPNVIGDSAATANKKIADAGLIMSVAGVTNQSSGSVRAILQSEKPGSEVAAGSVVRVQFSDGSVTD